jgi:pSer/pThr/pTyr-binding forkhead associated (FHA) protein
MNANLVLLKKNGTQKTFPLPSSVTVVGRRHDCDLCIPLPSVSRRHCQLSLSDGELSLRDLESRWGTFLNGNRLENEATLKAGDYVKIGPLTFVIQIDGKPEQITPPPTAEKKPAKLPDAEPKPKPPAGQGNEEFDDLNASDSFIELDESDDSLDDLKKD